MDIAVVTLDGFNEIDSLVLFTILNRLRSKGFRARITSPSSRVTSMNGLTIGAERGLDFIREADAVVIGSGSRTRDLIKDQALLRALNTNPSRQLVASQCSGVLFLDALNLLPGRVACTDSATRAYAEALGISILNQSFHAQGPVATAGGCLSSQYLAAWLIVKLGGEELAREALVSVAPFGEENDYVDRALAHVVPRV